MWDSHEDDAYLHPIDFGSTIVTLRIAGESLDPEAVTGLLGVAPTLAYRKNDVVTVAGRKHTKKIGAWHRSALRTSERCEFHVVIESLLNEMTEDTSVWHWLADHFRMDLFCGLFAEHYNGALLLPPSLTERLAARRLELALEIYGVLPHHQMDQSGLRSH